jgi:glycosyltransferase involved in cell wall biosynthesis
LRRRGVDASILPCDIPRAFGHSSQGAEAIGEGVAEATVVNVHTLWHPFNTVARKACERFGRPYVLTPHGMLDPYSLSVGWLCKRVYLALREQRNLQSAAGLIFTTPLEEKLGRESLPTLGKAAIIPLGADRPPSKSRETLQADFERRFPSAAGRRRILFVGRLHPKKGLEKILASMPEIVASEPQALLVIAGSGDTLYVTQLHKLAHHFGMSGHVLFTGHLDVEARWQAFAAGEIFVLPSYQENFAIAVAEAMHAGLPVVITANVNLWPFVESAGAGIVLHDAPVYASLTAAVRRLLQDQSVARAMGERGRQFAGEHFDWQNTARLTYSLYQKLIAGNQQVSVNLPG